MLPQDVKELVGDTPGMSLAQGRRIWKFIEETRPKCVLELGTGHGVGACYIAAALHVSGGDSVVTVDLESSRNRTPNVWEFKSRLEVIGQKILVRRERTSYHYYLRKALKSRFATFDLVYLDGGHTWTDTGFAFFLVDKLLVPGGWLIFDDLNWSFDRSPTLKNTPEVHAMPVEESAGQQVTWVFDELVAPHPGYRRVYKEDGWGFAQKCYAGERRS